MMNNLLLSVSMVFLLLSAEPIMADKTHPVGVTGAPGHVEKVVFSAAKEFSTKYCRDFISMAEYEHLVMGGNHYCQVLLSYGLFGSLDFAQDNITNILDDPNIGRFRVLGAYNSMFLLPNGKNYATKIRERKSNSSGLEWITEGYNQYPLIPPVARKRAMEIYGPLNPKKTNCYSFSLRKGDLTGNCEVSFSTKQGVFPGKTRLYGKGVLYLKKGTIVGFRLEDVEDRYSHFINRKGEKLVSLTHYSYEVRYCYRGDEIYPESIEQKVKWVAPTDKSRDLYFFAEINPCQAPFESTVETVTKVEFNNYVKLDKAHKDKYSDEFLADSTAWRITLTNPVIDDVVKGLIQRIPSWLQIKKDLESGGVNLEEQNTRQSAIYYDDSGDVGSSKSFVENMRNQDRVSQELSHEFF